MGVRGSSGASRRRTWSSTATSSPGTPLSRSPPRPPPAREAVREPSPRRAETTSPRRAETTSPRRAETLPTVTTGAGTGPP